MTQEDRVATEAGDCNWSDSGITLPKGYSENNVRGNRMGAKEVDLKDVPAIGLIQARLTSIDPGLSVSAAGYDFDA